MKARVRLKVQGRVQGVFYRQSTADQARMLGLKGWVANENDGSVSVDAHGDKEKLESLIIWCWQGPPSAKVTHIDVAWIEEDESAHSGFQILR